MMNKKTKLTENTKTQEINKNKTLRAKQRQVRTYIDQVKIEVCTGIVPITPERWAIIPDF